MGCTSSKENNTSHSTTITNDNQQLINDHFRKWLKSNRPKVDEYVLNTIISKNPQTNDIDDYRTIVKKALDLLIERYDIKTINKLNKLVQKEVSLASPKKVAYTIDILKQTAEKLHQGQIIFDDQTTATNGDVTNDMKTSGQLSSGQPGIVLKEALEKARILFYKGKQAAIFANPNGGYDVRIIDENDDVLNHDGNLLRSIIVTEVKMRPKPVTTTLPKFTPPPPPPVSTKLLDEHEIGDDFRRSIDAALKGLEAIYHTSPNPSNNDQQQDVSQTDYQPKLVGAVNDMNDIMLDTIETLTQSEIGNPVPTQHETIDKFVSGKSNDSPSTKESLSNSVGLTSSLHNDAQEKVTLNNENHDNDQITFDEHNKNLSESLLPSVDVNSSVKQPSSHNVTYTEIIRSESRDGEQSRRFITESYDENPLKDNDEKTSLKVVTKSEFSNDPTLGEKVMEQSVQVITVKVRNETIKTTNPSQTTVNDLSNTTH